MTTYDPAWLDAMYNNRALVPAHPEHFRRWARDSADVVRSQPRVLDVRYGGGPNEHLDIFRSQATNAPVVVFIHGGYWRSLDKKDHSFVAPAFMKDALVVVPNYALAPKVTIPQIVMQMVRAVAWTYRHAHEYGGDPKRLTVIGHSAGGHLAAMMLSCLWPVFGRDLPADLVKGALSISGLYDLEPVMHVPFLKDDLRITRGQVAQASPSRLPAPKQGVLYTVAGADESEEFLRHNRLIAQAWGKERVPVCEELAGLNHFSVLEDIVVEGSRLNALARELALKA